MRFLVNGQELNVDFDGEKTAYDVVVGFGAHLQKDQMIASVDVNGKSFAPDDDALKDIAFEEIEEIAFQAGTQNQIAVFVLMNAKELTFNIAADLKKNGFSHKKEYLEAIAWIQDSLSAVGAMAPFEMPEVKILNSTASSVLSYLQRESPEESRAAALSSIMENLVQYFDSIALKFQSGFVIDKKDLLEAIEHGFDLLPEISEGFQTGQDKDALAKVHVVINLLENCTLYLKSHLKEIESADEVYENLNGILNEMVDAFEKGDFVLIGDLMEYELPEQLENYRDLIR